MLTIRLQRTGRKGHAMFRVVVQDARQTPSSGKVVAMLGSYDPHSKVATVDKTKASFYMEHGAQPSPRVARMLKQEGVKLPKWVVMPADNKRAIRNPEKLRRNRPPEAEKTAEEPAAPAEAEVAEPAAETKTETPADETSATEPADASEPTEQ